MAFNLTNTINSILGYKKEWDTANKSGDTAKANTAAENAKKYYEQLKNSGYTTAASKLSSKNYDDAVTYADKFLNTSGKTQFRPFVTSEAKKYGISEDEINKAVSFNENTGEVSLGGVNLGTPDALYDGVSYWSDTSSISDAVKNYAANRTLSNPELITNRYNSAVDKNDEQWDTIGSDKAAMQEKYNSLYDYSMADPFATSEGKSIMNRYNLSALSARDNTTAAGAAANSGNIDSNTAANAMRQQSALVSQGQGAVMDMYNNRIARAQGILESLGGYNTSVYDAQNANIANDMNIASTIFNNEQTAKNNEVANLKAIADTTGYIPDEWATSDNIYFNSDGTLKDEYLTDDFDNTGGFSTIIANAEAAGNTKAAEMARVARAVKLLGNYSKYGKYDDGNYSVNARQQTEDAREFDKSAALEQSAQESAERIAKGEVAAQERMNQQNNQTQKYISDNSSRAEKITEEADAWDDFIKQFEEGSSGWSFACDIIKPKYDASEEVDVKKVIEDNATKYGLTKADARKICIAYGVDTSWIEGSNLFLM